MIPEPLASFTALMSIPSIVPILINEYVPATKPVDGDGAGVSSVVVSEVASLVVASVALAVVASVVASALAVVASVGATVVASIG